MRYADFSIENEYWQKGYSAIVGIDEVGRGCFAGPVVAAGVVFPKDCVLDFQVADSKVLSTKQRESLVDKIKQTALVSAIASIDVPTINAVGIGKACHAAYRSVLDQLHDQFDFIFMDAFFIEGIAKEKQNPIKGGDALSASIAAASIIAKVHRDDLMTNLDTDYPGYGFAQHKGYGTKAHQAAIATLGLSDLHRTSFALEKFLHPPVQ